ncbi:hypothetical protein K1719_012994 [Acacia pycnantha]|nr:hypothetical protein K1719_012994 [Acacia pycnantha]
MALHETQDATPAHRTLQRYHHTSVSTPRGSAFRRTVRPYNPASATYSSIFFRNRSRRLNSLSPLTRAQWSRFSSRQISGHRGTGTGKEDLV